MQLLAELATQTWTGEALAGLFVLMVFLGLVVPRWIVKNIMKERDEWKDQAVSLSKTNEMLSQAAKESIEPSKTIAHAVTSAQDRNGVPDESVE